MSLPAGLRSVDFNSRTTPLGLRFYDRTGGTIVGDGLDVLAYLEADPVQRVSAIQNRASAWIFPSLPMLGGTQLRGDDGDPWNPPPRQRNYRVEVRDLQRRFQPFSFPVAAPHRGFFGWSCAGDASPPWAPPLDSIPLFSSPTRPTPLTFAALRAQLVDGLTGGPAAWAVLEVTVPGQPAYRGIADENGGVAVLFAYPEASDTGEGPSLSPTGPSDPPYTDQSWTLGVRVFWAPRPASDLLPDLCTTLSQPEVVLWEDSARTNPLTNVTLRYGRELIVRSTEHSSPPRPLSVVLVTP
jgi:hypothetical protein